MVPSTHPYPTNAASIRPDGAHYPQKLRVQVQTNSHTHSHTHSRPPNPGRDKPLPPLPDVQRALELEASLERQRDTIHPSFYPAPYTVDTKTRLLRNGKYRSPIPHTPVPPCELSCNRRSLPPPYSALDPGAPPRSSRAVHFVHRLVDNPHKRRGNVGHPMTMSGPSSPLDASPNSSRRPSNHGQSPGGLVRSFFRRWREWLRLQGTRNR